MKLSLNDVASLANPTSALSTLKANNDATEQAMENTLSRDGTQPNSMGANLDMNNNRVINLPAPVGVTEPVRLQELNNVKGNLDTDRVLVASAVPAATAANASATQAAAALASIRTVYLGSFPTDAAADTAYPTKTAGARYFNTTNSADRVWTGSAWTTASPVIPDGSITDAKFSSVTSDRLNASKVKAVSPYDGTYAPSVITRLFDTVNLKALADLTVSGNFSAALQYALNQGYRKIILPGSDTLWNMTTGVTLPTTPVWLAGEGNAGRATSGGTLINYTGTNPMFTIPNNGVAPEITDLKAVRQGVATVAATGGQIGILGQGLIEDVRLENLWLEGFFNSVNVQATSFSYMKRVISNKAQDNGFLLTNSSVASGLQWTLDGCLAQLSGADGFHYETSTAAGPCSVGEVINCTSYGNNGWGLSAQDTVQSPLTGMRLNGGFYGEDRNGGVRIRSRRGQHKIDGASFEIAGTATTGCPTNTLSPSNAGTGLKLEQPSDFSAGTDFSTAAVTGCTMEFNTRCGIATGFSHTQIAGNHLRGNGQANVSGDFSNINIAGSGTDVSAEITGNSAYLAKGFGVYMQNDNHVLVGNFLGGTGRNNTAGAFATATGTTTGGVYANNKTT